jgi:hypothetical protein
MMQLVLKYNYNFGMCILQYLETIQYSIIQLFLVWILQLFWDLFWKEKHIVHLCFLYIFLIKS